MKKAVKVNIGGQIFHLDEDAFQLLEKYLDKITAKFKKEAGGKEIVNDIEIRVAELFAGKMEGNKQVINLDDVKEIIEQMGEPEQIYEGGEEEETYGKQGYKKSKRLYRDPDTAILGGVSGGLSAYMNLDIVWVRLIFVLLFFAQGFGLLLYIILWIALPKAKTTAQKLEMKGEFVTISNIEKSIREEYEEVKENLDNFKKSESYGKISDVFRDFFAALGEVLKFVLKLIVVLFALSLIIAGFVSLFSFTGILFFKHTFFPFFWHGIPPFPFQHIFDHVVDPVTGTMVTITLFFTIAIPLLALIYGGIKLMFRLKTRDRVLGLTAFLLWFLSAVVFVSLLFMEGKNFRSRETARQSFYLEEPANNVLYLDVDEEGLIEEMGDYYYWSKGDLKILVDEDKNEIYGIPLVDIEKSRNNQFGIEVKKKAFGSNNQEARELARDIHYHWQQQDSLLLLGPYYLLMEVERWRMPGLKVILQVPVGMTIVIHEALEEYLHDVETEDGYWDKELAGKAWVMSHDGLIESE